jgi:hypothetical protein
MRKTVAWLPVAVAVMLIGIPALAGAQAQQGTKARHSGHAKQTNHAKQTKHTKHAFIVLSRHHSRLTLFVQRGRRSTSAHAASCLAGQFAPNYCTAPIEQNLFGAYAWNDGDVTFGSNNGKTCQALGWSSSYRSCGIYTTVPNTLLVAFVGASGNGQTMSVTCTTAGGGNCPVTFKRVNAENSGGGDSEVWYADATNVISQSSPIFVTTSDSREGCGSGRSACDASLQVVTFQNAITAGATGVQATGVGASSVCYSNRGAPTCSLTTTEPDSLVWAALNNPSSASIPTWPSNQFAVGVADGANNQTFYSQFLGTCTANANGSHPCTTMQLPASGLYENPFVLAPTATPTSGGRVTINDTAPTNNPYNEVVVEIL